MSAPAPPSPFIDHHAALPPILPMHSSSRKERFATMFFVLAMYLVFLPLFFFHVVAPVEGSTVRRQLRRVTKDVMFEVKTPMTDCGAGFAAALNSVQLPNMEAEDASVAEGNTVARARVWEYWLVGAGVCLVLAVLLWGLDWRARRNHMVARNLSPTWRDAAAQAGIVMSSAALLMMAVILGEFLFVGVLPMHVDPLDSNTVKAQVIQSMEQRAGQCDEGVIPARAAH